MAEWNEHHGKTHQHTATLQSLQLGGSYREAPCAADLS